MALYRHDLPQLSDDLFLTDAGLETDMIFNRGFELPAFASHTLLDSPEGRSALTDYLTGFLDLAATVDAGLLIDVGIWRAQRFFADELGVTPDDLAQINHDCVTFASDLRAARDRQKRPIVLSGSIGPRGDAYAPENWISAEAAQSYHREQAGWLAETDVDFLAGLTFTSSDEAIGLIRAAQEFNLPIAMSFTVETDGRLPTGQSLGDAIRQVDDQTAGGALYYMINCAHPSHILPGLDGGDWTGRLKGLRCNASKMSHAELDECEALDEGNPQELSREYEDLISALPGLTIFGGCCGTDLRHVNAIARLLRPHFN